MFLRKIFSASVPDACTLRVCTSLIEHAHKWGRLNVIKPKQRASHLIPGFSFRFGPRKNKRKKLQFTGKIKSLSF